MSLDSTYTTLSNQSKRKIDNSDQEIERTDTLNIKHPNTTISPKINMSSHKTRPSLTNDDLEELKVQLLGVIHMSTWENSLNLLNTIIENFLHMKYDLNYFHSPYSKSYTLRLQYPWYSLAERMSNPDLLMHSKEVRLQCILPLTPLQYAAYLGAEQCILPLLRAGVAKSVPVLNYTNYEFANKTAAEIALQRGYHRVFHLIEEFDNMNRIAPDISGINLQVQNLEQTSIDTPSSTESTDIAFLPKPKLNRVTSNEVFFMSSSPTKMESGMIDSMMMNSYLNSSSSSFPFSVNNVESVPVPPRQWYGVGAHPGYKNPSEDRTVVLDIYADLPDDGEMTENKDSLEMMLYLILDGHGGSHYAEEASKKLPLRIKKRIFDYLPNIPNAREIESILIEEITDLDKDLVRLGDNTFQYTKGGTTCVVAVVTSSDIIVANVGDSPAIVFTSDGKLIHQSDDHNPDNALEHARITKLGATVVLSSEFGDLRVQSQRGQLTVTRALGQYEFKKGNSSTPNQCRPVTEQIVTCLPQTYIWPLSNILPQSSSSDPTSQPSRVFLSLYSDSFTEALRDHKSGRIVAATGRTEQVIGNFLTNSETLEFLLYELKKYDYDVTAAAQDIAEKQVNKFYMYNSYFGDNTSIILVELGTPKQLQACGRVRVDSAAEFF